MIDEQTAIQIVQAHLAASGEVGLTYTVEGTKKHEGCWAIGVRPHNAQGQPVYDGLAFEVDENSGALSQW